MTIEESCGKKLAKKLLSKKKSMNEAVGVHHADYKFGHFINVHDGAHTSYPLHPKHQEIIRNLDHGQEGSFTDETGARVKVSRSPAGSPSMIHFMKSHSSRVTTVPRAKLFAESHDLDDDDDGDDVKYKYKVGDKVWIHDHNGDIHPGHIHGKEEYGHVSGHSATKHNPTSTSVKAWGHMVHHKMKVPKGYKGHPDSYTGIGFYPHSKIMPRTIGESAVSEETLDELSYKTLKSYRDAGGKTEAGNILALNKMRKANKDKTFVKKGGWTTSDGPKVAATNPPKPPKRYSGIRYMYDEFEQNVTESLAADNRARIKAEKAILRIASRYEKAAKTHENKTRMANQKKTVEHHIAHIVSSEVSNHYPDTDGFDKIHQRMRKEVGHRGDEYDTYDKISKVIRKHLGAKNFSDYVEKTHRQYDRDGMNPNQLHKSLPESTVKSFLDVLIENTKRD